MMRKTHLVCLSLLAACSGDVQSPVTGVVPGAPVAVVPGAIPGTTTPGAVVNPGQPGAPVPVGVGTPPVPGVVQPAPGVVQPAPGVVQPAPGVVPGSTPLPATPVALGALAPTPVARLTNDEFVASVVAVLGISQDDERLVEATNGLPAEPRIGGLRNDVAGQILSQVILANYMSFAAVAAEIFLDGVGNEAQLHQKLSCAAGSAMQACISGFVEILRTAAFRRPLTATEQASIAAEWQAFDQLIADAEVDTNERGAAFQVLMARVTSYIRTTLLSPDFLLQVETGIESNSNVKTLRPTELATRLSYFLTGTPPDSELQAAVAAGTLSDPAVRMAQAERLLDHPAARGHVVKQVTDWLALNDLASDVSRQQLDTFVGDWYEQERPFSDFYQGMIPVTHADGTQSEEPFGVLGSPALLESHTLPPTAPFITRGVFIVESLLCTHLPDDVPVEAFDSEAVTDLQVYEDHGRSPCATCHVFFDNYGAALQQFDARTSEYTPGPTTLGTGFELYDVSNGNHPGTVDDPAGLAAYLASSEKAAECVANFWYRSAARRQFEEAGADNQVVGHILQDWRNGNAPSLKDLLRRVISSERFSTLLLPQ